MGTKVFCYRNLHQKGVVWSVKNVKTGLVIDRSKTVYISMADLIVSQAGRDRVIREKRKHVHAGIRGKRIKAAPKNVVWIKATYNPYLYNSFVTSEDEIPIHSARYAKLNRFGLWIGNLKR